MENLTIIGSGCAGWTAAVYAARANLDPLLITGQQPGGLLTTTTMVENFPGFSQGVDGFELMQEMQMQAERFGTRVKFGATVQSVSMNESPFQLDLGSEVIKSKSVIIATGASHRHLGIPGESELENRGVTYCATCDGALPVFRNKPLVVVGGGDTACEEAMFLSRFGSKVYLVHRRDTLRASKVMADRTLANEKIVPIWNAVVEEILDVAHNLVTGVRLRDVNTGQMSDLACAGVFAAGDCADSIYRQAITAAGMGCRAAMDCERWLAAQHPMHT